MSTTITVSQAATIEAIVNIFETSHVLGEYGQVTVIQGDTGHLTFGRSQTTLGSGNLHKLLQQYCDNPGARFGRRLSSVLPQTEAKDVSLDTDVRVHNELRASADDPVMRDVQDQFFDKACACSPTVLLTLAWSSVRIHRCRRPPLVTGIGDRP